MLLHLRLLAGEAEWFGVRLVLGVPGDDKSSIGIAGDLDMERPLLPCSGT